MNVKLKKIAVALSGLSVLALVACQSMGTGQKASSTLESKSGSNAKGEINFVWQGDDVLITGKFSGLKPNAEQGFHVHEKGDCSSADATSAGPHFNPETKAPVSYTHLTLPTKRIV